MSILILLMTCIGRKYNFGKRPFEILITPLFWIVIPKKGGSGKKGGAEQEGVARGLVFCEEGRRHQEVPAADARWLPNEALLALVRVREVAEAPDDRGAVHNLAELTRGRHKSEPQSMSVKEY